MTQRSFPYDGVPVTEEDYFSLQAAQRGAGIIGDPSIFTDLAVDRMGGVVRHSNHLAVDGALLVTPGAGRTVDVAIGRAVVPGFMFESDATVNLAIDANATGSVRHDKVVVRWDFSANTAALTVIDGAPTSTLTRAFPIWDTPLADLAVPDGFATLADGDISSRRRWAGEDVPAPLRGFGAGNGQSRYYPVGALGHASELMLIAQSIHLVPFVAAPHAVLGKVSIVSGDAAVTGTVRLFLYSSTLSRGIPLTLVADLGGYPLSTSSTIYEGVVGTGAGFELVNPGIWYVGVANLTGSPVGPVKCGFASLSSGSALDQPPAHVGGVNLAVATILELPMAAYLQDGLASAPPSPVNPTLVNPTPNSPLVYLSGI